MAACVARPRRRLPGAEARAMRASTAGCSSASPRTGIYCRPVCRVRTPRRENCRFFDSRAQAEAAAFRPCLKCRPEIAPGLSAMDSSRSLADSAALMLDARRARRQRRTSLPAIAAAPGRHRPPPAPHLPGRAWRGAARLPDDAAPAAGQAAAHRHRAAGDAGGAGQRLRQPAPLQRRLCRTLPAATRRSCGARAPAGAPAPPAGALRLAWRPPYDVAGAARLLRAAAGARRRSRSRGWNCAARCGWPHRGQRAGRLAGGALRARAPTNCT